MARAALKRRMTAMPCQFARGNSVKGTTMTSAELREIVVSSEFKQEVEMLSSYLASIMQERPIIYVIVQRLWPQFFPGNQRLSPRPGADFGHMKRRTLDFPLKNRAWTR